VADLNLAECLRYAQGHPTLLAEFPAVKAWLETCQSRAAFQRMWAARTGRTGVKRHSSWQSDRPRALAQGAGAHLPLRQRKLSGKGPAMKKIGFLSFGHWSDERGSAVRSAADVLTQSIELAEAAEELGADGAYFRVHHFARQLASPFPLLAAVGARTKKIEIGTGVIDMRYENPHYMVEDAGSADLISGGRLQLGISRGSPEQVIDGWRHFGYAPKEGETDQDLARDHALTFLSLLEGKGFAQPNPRPMFPNPPGLLRLEPHSEGPARPHLVGRRLGCHRDLGGATLGMHLQSSTLKWDESGEPFHVQQAKQIRKFREAWKEAGHASTPRASVSRSIFAITSEDRMYFGRAARNRTRSASSTTPAPSLAAAMPGNPTS
jgi:alkanesulfonate monooxygenase SsuD/methylene tetrahydromethanopterin reductase-like flavin-dependent oxidoreductase (luciferase family)